MIDFVIVLVIIAFTGALVMLAVLVGGWVMFKGRAVHGERFIGGVPKGQIFNVPDALDPEEPTEAEKNVLARTNEFLKKLSGGQ